jgi:hypothetical protein
MDRIDRIRKNKSNAEEGFDFLSLPSRLVFILFILSIPV